MLWKGDVMSLYRNIDSEENMALIEEFRSAIKRNYTINNELYNEYNVKRGLRNANGTGVLVGLTRIGDVHAYIMDENEKVPVEGRLLYRGIDINDFVEGFQRDRRFGFEECCYLLLFGELPTREQLEAFTRLLSENRRLPDGFTRDLILKAPSKDIMIMLSRSLLAMYSYDQDPDDTSIGNVLRQCIGIVAYLPTLAAYAYQALAHYHYNQNLHINSPQPGMGTAENLLHMLRPDGKFTELEAEVLDLALVLHAEHGGGNNSTFTIHVVSSTGTDTYSALAAAIGSLKGPRHGGANIKVMQMMEDIKQNITDWEDEDEVYEYLKKILRKEAFDRSGLIYGTGHAVYTLSDPRAVLLKKRAADLAKEKEMEKEFSLYNLIEKLAPKAFFEVKQTDKFLCANVDFYSGFVYRMLNIPADYYTPIFACGRMPGWCAHRMEELLCGGRIIRPAYKNVSGKVDYKSLSER
jgi:citrate synthase